MTGRVSIGRNATPVETSSTDSPSSGTGGPEAFSVGKGALTAMMKRSTVPLWMWSMTQARTLEATNTGQIRLMADADIRVPAMPAVRRGSAPE